MYTPTLDSEPSLSYSAIQNDISFPENKGGSHVNERVQRGGNVEMERSSDSSSMSSTSSESEDNESMVSRHCDRSESRDLHRRGEPSSQTHSNSLGEPVVHPAVGSGDFGSGATES